MPKFEYRKTNDYCPECREQLQALTQIDPLLGGAVDETVIEYACSGCPKRHTLSEVENRR
jgi:ribosomal protein L44E